MISRTQVSAVQALASRDPHLNGVPPENRAVLVDFASATNWHDGDLAKVLQCLEAPPEKEKQKSRPMQQFAPGILGYFTSKEWDLLLDSQGGAAQELVFNRVIQLSGRNLSEPSLKFMTSFLMWLTNQEKAVLDPNRHQEGFLFECEKGLQGESSVPGQARALHRVAANIPSRLAGVRADAVCSSLQGGPSTLSHRLG